MLKIVDGLLKDSYCYKWVCVKVYFFKIFFIRECDIFVFNNRFVIFLKCSYWLFLFICIYDRNGGFFEKIWIYEWCVGGNYFVGYWLDEDFYDVGWYWRFWVMEMWFDIFISVFFG